MDGDPVGQGVVSHITTLVTMDVNALHLEEIRLFVLGSSEYVALG